MAIGKGFEFDGLVVISIDYKKITDDKDRPNKISFAEWTTGNEAKTKSGDKLREHNREFKDTATFVENVKYTFGKDEPGMRRFEGDLLTIEEAKAKFEAKYNKKYEKEIQDGAEVVPFFAIHGYTNEAGLVMTTCRNKQKHFDKQSSKGKTMNVIIPVIWPSEGSTASYGTDKDDNAPMAAKEFGAMVGKFNVFEKKNLLCHSLGNRIFRMAADPNIKFDNIFLAAADIRHNIFDKEYIVRAKGNKNATQWQGMNIFGMLTKKSNGQPKGKIYCLYNGSDYALGASTGVNWVNRLGQVGIGFYDSIGPGWTFDPKRLLHPDIYGHTANFDVYPKLPVERYKSHSYQWDGFSIDYYREKIEKTI
mmetsp:Transcript_1088/g.1170  ORF Transcript_1088/g.1170 Transcript_1088/m.1170 type:complete len:363 (-) Transcript_1088:238-1326(-)